MQREMKETATKYTLKDKFKALGPGFLIVGSFIGPGTLASSTRAGANYGYTLLWCIIFSVIAVIVLQGMAARLGIVTQESLSENILSYFKDTPFLRNLIVIITAIPIVIGGFAYMSGDLTGTSIGISALTGYPTHIVAPLWGVGILLILLFAEDALKHLEKLLGLCVVLMAGVFLITMFVVKPDMGALFSGLIPSIPEDGGLMTCLALIGTTVVPYNIFLHTDSAKRTWHSTNQIPLCNFGTYVPMLVGGIVTGAILITAATVMRGMSVQNALDMAVQLEPTLGSYAQPFMAIGLIAAGISSSVITPIGVSYVLAGFFGWKTNRSDKRYMGTNIAVLLTGIVVAGMGFNPIGLIMAAQAVNGIVLPSVVGIVVFLASRKIVMGEFKNGIIANTLGILIFAISLILGVSSIISMF